jgi:hypothetical protein
MLFTCYLRDGVAYVPTMGRRKSEPIYTTIEPVSAVLVSNPEDLRRALLETIARKNIIIPDPDAKALRAPPLILKYAGVKSWSAFFRNASMWSIREDEGAYKILSYRKTSQRLLSTGRRAGNPTSDGDDGRRCRRPHDCYSSERSTAGLRVVGQAMVTARA